MDHKDRPDKYHGSSMEDLEIFLNRAQAWLEESILARAAALARKKLWAEAGQVLRPLLEEGKESPAALDLAAKMAAQQNLPGEARSYWVRALEIEPHNINYQQSLARCRKLPPARPDSSGKQYGAQKVWVPTMLIIIFLMGLYIFHTHGLLKDRERELSLLRAQGPAGEVNASPRFDEARIREMQMTLQASSRLPLNNFSIKEQNGVLHIRGGVSDLHTRCQIEQAALRLPGVRAIDVSALVLEPHYPVQAGDSLYSISEKLYGSPRYWHDLAEKNHIGWPFVIYEGQILDTLEGFNH